MRTKTLLLTAALSAAGVAASMAQVYSVNVVGYVNYTIPAGGWAICGNPLNNGNNAVNTVIPALPSGSTGCQIFQWNSTAQNFKDAVVYVEGSGWISPTDPNPTINPGDGWFIQNITATPITLTFVGEVMQGALSTKIAAGNGWSLVGSKVPQAASLGTPSDATSLQFPATDLDLVFAWDTSKQTYLDSYTYVQAAGGWLSASDPNTAGPVIPVAGGFWVQRSAASGPDWNRTFNVQ